VICITQNINKTEVQPQEVIVEYCNKPKLIKDYLHFCNNPDTTKLNIITEDKFEEACKVFNNLFKRIEAAGGIVRNNQHEYLFIKRLGIWDLPKGKLHKGESIQKGALREVTEETGLTNLIISKQLPSTYHIYTDRKEKEVLKETYWFEMQCTDQQNLVPQTEEDITEVKWFSESDLHIPVNNTYSSLRHLLELYTGL